jgi:hypothetical protein
MLGAAIEYPTRDIHAETALGRASIVVEKGKYAIFSSRRVVGPGMATTSTDNTVNQATVT